jgi:hypothetical protein
MKSKIFILLTAIIILTSGNLFSQIAKAPGVDYSRIYDISTVETVVGQIRSIDKIYPSNNSSYGTHMSIFTPTGDITVHLGPGWYIDSQILQLKENDNVIVTGSKVTYEGNIVIIAKEVTKDGEVLNLRDDIGYPLWAGQRAK